MKLKKTHPVKVLIKKVGNKDITGKDIFTYNHNNLDTNKENFVKLWHVIVFFSILLTN